MENKPRLLRITTVPISLKLLLRGQLEFMMHQQFEVLAVSAEGPEIASIKANGIPHEVVHMTRKITPWQDLMALVALISLIRRFRPHIVHTHTPKAGLLGMIAAWICRVPVRLHTVAGLPLMEATGMKRTILVMTERLTYRCATKVLPNSKGMLDYIEQHILRSPKLSIIGKGSSNGIDTKFFSTDEQVKTAAARIRADHAIRADEVVFCFVGRIVRDKGINEMVAAFTKISAEIPSRLILVGPFEDDLDPVSPETRHAIETNDSIISLGYQHDVRIAMAASDVFVFPSYREGFPNVVMQACCMELPCIVSDINGCNEIISHHENGVIVKPKDAAQLYSAMHFLATNKETRMAFAAKARRFVVDNYDQSYLWTLLLEEYHKQLRNCI